MRITSQMLNESAQKAGLNLNRPTLLDYVKDKSGNSLFTALSKTRQSSTDYVNKNRYQKIEDGADKLMDTAQKLLDSSEESLFSKAKADGDYTDVYSAIKTLLESYNDTIDNSKFLTGTLETFYTKMLKEIPTEDSEVLEAVGITIERSGKVDVDMNKLKAVDTATLEDIFGKESEFVSKLNIIAEKISENATANIESLTSGYTSTGTSYTANNSKYDFLG